TVLGLNPDGRARSAAAILALRGRPGEETPGEDVHDINTKLIGWPWAENTFSWVEPTAWAILALRRAGYGGHPRVAEGTTLLLDRVLESGGVNYGNRNVLGRPLAPLPGPTALMLLALQGRADEPRLQKSLAYLCGAALEGDDL